MILIIDNYDSFTYNLYQSLASFHEAVKVIRNDKITLPEIQNMQPRGIILSPGPGRPENANICLPIIQSVLSNELSCPILGVCLGHQAIALTLGAQVVQSKEIFHGKVDSVKHIGQGLYFNLPNPLRVGRYHSLIVERDSLPDCFRIEAENNNHIIMGIAHLTSPIYGVQFHPESILTECGDQLLKNFVNLCNNHNLLRETI
ncbi:MAG: aminodeoxychorismate/anthranilate synthase component II [Gammaproteobacteria bacterium]|nr:aminodeoxychorismate/anthranilate synthase component II [Gammaproteobacteria bacterium]